MMIANDRFSFSLIDSQSYDNTGKSSDVVVTTPIRQSYDKTGKSIDVFVTTPIRLPQVCHPVCVVSCASIMAVSVYKPSLTEGKIYGYSKPKKIK